MSIHKSLKTKGKLVRMRNVLTRGERIQVLIRDGRWTEEEDSPYGLPKVKVAKVKKRGKKKKEEEATEEAAATAGAEKTP